MMPENIGLPITDWIGEMDFTGIESFAVDPMDPDRIYLAAGIYSGTRAAILRSADRGRTWQQTEVPFKMGGNEAGRFNGERLAVDPHDGKILFFGSRRDGLWCSEDSGVSWKKIEGFPQIETADGPEFTTRTNTAPRFRGNFRPQAVGIVFVQFDPRNGEAGKPTPVIYAGVSTAGTNFFRSDDGGKNWSAVPGQPLGLRPNHAALSPDGTLYLTYGREAGPNTMAGGAVWKFVPSTGAWSEITPLKSPGDTRAEVVPVSLQSGDERFGYGAVAVDAQHPSDIVVTTFAHWHPHDEVFRSTDGGASWVALLKGAQWDYSNAPYTEQRTPHWMGSIQIDPFDSNHVLFTTGYGIWNCNDLDRRAEIHALEFCLRRLRGNGSTGAHQPAGRRALVERRGGHRRFSPRRFGCVTRNRDFRGAEVFQYGRFGFRRATSRHYRANGHGRRWCSRRDLDEWREKLGRVQERAEWPRRRHNRAVG